MRVLIVGHDLRLGRALSGHLRKAGWEVCHAATLAARSFYGYHLVVLDVGRSGADGVEDCKRIRGLSDVPIIVLSGRDCEGDRVRGLYAGADDYLAEPLGLAELAARVLAVTRRRRGSAEERIVVGDVRVELRANRVLRGGRDVRLTPTEFAILVKLARSPDEIVGREVLLRDIWNDVSRPTGRTLDVHITHLRAKLGAPSPLKTVRGVGYRLIAAALPDPVPALR